MEPAISIDGLTTTLCSAGPRETMDRLVAEVQARGMTALARIDHAAGRPRRASCSGRPSS